MTPNCESCKKPIYVDKEGYRFHGSLKHGTLWWHYKKCPNSAKSNVDHTEGK